MSIPLADREAGGEFDILERLAAGGETPTLSQDEMAAAVDVAGDFELHVLGHRFAPEAEQAGQNDNGNDN